MRRVTQLAALAGAVDTAAFLASRRQLFSEASRRAYGGVAVLGLWAGIASAARRDARGLCVGLATVNAAGQAAMLGVHLRHGIAGPRVWIGAALGGVALGGALASR